MADLSRTIEIIVLGRDRLSSIQVSYAADIIGKFLLSNPFHKPLVSSEFHPNIEKT